MYTITKAQRDALISYFTQGTGSKLPYNEVADILKILTQLVEAEETKKEK